MIDNKVGIYIHVPFCLSRCHYCDFCSTRATGEDILHRYTEQVCREIEMISDKIKAEKGSLPVADTVYLGGGTPTLLSEDMIARLLCAVNDAFGIEKDAEMTAEANPKTADREKLFAMRSLGINRLSIGMQSMHDSELKALGRIHKSADFLGIYEQARGAGFDNVSVDLMYGIPNQTRQSFAESVERLISLSPEHVSSYCLTVEEGTRFDKMRDSLSLPDEDTVSDMYADMTDVLQKSGYEKYEISNFSHKGRQSLHNIKYWERESYLGFGPAAHSFFDGVRYAHTRDIEAYLCGEDIYTDIENISADEARREAVMLGMRLSRGIDIKKFNSHYACDFEALYGRAFRKYCPEYVSLDSNVCRFTHKGMFVSNFILSDVLDFGD